MPAVLVHGNPETPAVWNRLVRQLQRTDVITPRLPGFGVDAPAGFGATKDEYAAWLIGELEAIGEPVDLVGHDWGGGFVLRVASLRPDLLRSWVTDIAGVFHPDYVWHDFAQIWQTPGAGEEFFASQADTPHADRAATFEMLGIGKEAAEDFASAAGPEMGRCVLALYRSAVVPELASWRADLPGAAARPGLVIAAEQDPFVGGPEKAFAVAAVAGARTTLLPGVGHWWMQADPAAGAAALESFWSSL